MDFILVLLLSPYDHALMHLHLYNIEETHIIHATFPCLTPQGLLYEKRERIRKRKERKVRAKAQKAQTAGRKKRISQGSKPQIVKWITKGVVCHMPDRGQQLCHGEPGAPEYQK
jgi:hypothetical protein